MCFLCWLNIRSLLPFYTSVAIHNDVTIAMLQSFVNALKDNQAVIFCLHGVVRKGEFGYGNRFNMDYDCFKRFLQFLKTQENTDVCSTINISNDI